MLAHLVANIQQQVQASGTDAGGGGAAGFGIGAAVSGLALTALLGGARSAWGAVNRADGLLFPGGRPAGTRQERQCRRPLRQDMDGAGAPSVPTDSSFSSSTSSRHSCTGFTTTRTCRRPTLCWRRCLRMNLSAELAEPWAGRRRRDRHRESLGRRLEPPLHRGRSGQMVDATASALKGSKYPPL